MEALILLALVNGIYLLSKRSINKLATILDGIFHNHHIVNGIIAFIFFPGTVLHEMAHFFMATILFLKVAKVNLLPQWERNSIKLGSVTYYKKDVFRSILVGIAPIFVGTGILWWLSLTGFFPAHTWWMNIILGYFIWVISSTMFSSRQDLIDILYVIPLIIFIVILVFVFKINVVGSVTAFIATPGFKAALHHVNNINVMLGIAFGVHVIANILFSAALYLRYRKYR